MKNRWSRLLSLALIFSVLSPPAFAQDDVLNAEWVMPGAPGDGYWGAVFMEPTFYPDSTSFLASYTANTQDDITSNHLCTTVNTESCAVDPTISYKAYIPVCSEINSRNCIDDFWLVLNGKRLNPVLDTYMPKSSPHHFNGDIAANLPEGKSTSIWTFSEEGNNQPKQYFAVSVIFRDTIYNPKKIFGKPSISIVIDPIEKITGNYSIPRASTTGNGWSISGCLSEGCGKNNVAFCAALDLNVCAKRIDHVEGIRYGIKLRITNPPITWIHGRLGESDFSSVNSSEGGSWSIEAAPVTLPVISGWLPKSEALEKLNWTGLATSKVNSWEGPISAGDSAVQKFSKWIPIMGDKAQALQKRWSLGSIASTGFFNGKTLEQCLPPNEIAGIVMSNATVYQDGPPSWNASDMTLDYKVAAPHFTPAGKEFLGTYQLRVNVDFARCIYGMKDVPLAATISIVNDEGISKVATSTMSVDSKWMNFNVSGFTFSAPVIKVKITEAKEEKAVELSTTLPEKSASQLASAALKKKTILCTKGKTTKTVKAVKPKCPTGYKKK